MIIESLFTIIASFGFGIIFNIRGKKLIFAAIGGGLCWFLYSLLKNYGISEIFSLFFASIAISIYSEIMARKLKTPVTTIVVSSLIPLVPGSGMYYTMHEAITGDINKSINMAFQTLASAGILAIGIILISTITRLITSKNRR